MAKHFTLIAAALVAVVSAGPATLNWHEADNCRGLHRTIVTIESGLCQTVPQTAQNTGYSVTCNDDNTGGIFAVCNTNDCGECDSAVQFLNGACLPNPSQYGSRSVNITCAPDQQPVNKQPVLQAGDFGVVWYEDQECPADGQSTLLVAEQALCQIVPGAPNLGYKVTCNQNGAGGTYEVCEDAECNNCEKMADFNNAQCLPNVKDGFNFGSQSVEFTCAVPAANADTQANRAMITWYGETDCNADENQQSAHRTVVLAQRGVCQRVPEAGTSYMINCGGNDQGNILFCNDGNCQDCPITAPFQNNDCNPNPAATGSASYKATCNPNAAVSMVPQTNDVLVQWFGPAQCADTTDPLHASSTIVLAPHTVCHTIPGPNANATSNAGYKVVCNQQGSGGVFSVCTNQCGSCFVNTPFQNGACLDNPAATGSQSVRFVCMPATANITSSAAAIAVSGLAAMSVAGAALFN